jgi:hypothetical protein
MTSSLPVAITDTVAVDINVAEPSRGLAYLPDAVSYGSALVVERPGVVVQNQQGQAFTCSVPLQPSISSGCARFLAPPVDESAPAASGFQEARFQWGAAQGHHEDAEPGSLEVHYQNEGAPMQRLYAVDDSDAAVALRATDGSQNPFWLTLTAAELQASPFPHLPVAVRNVDDTIRLFFTAAAPPEDAIAAATLVRRENLALIHLPHIGAVYCLQAPLSAAQLRTYVAPATPTSFTQDLGSFRATYLYAPCGTTATGVTRIQIQPSGPLADHAASTDTDVVARLPSGTVLRLDQRTWQDVTPVQVVEQVVAAPSPGTGFLASAAQTRLLPSAVTFDVASQVQYQLSTSVQRFSMQNASPRVKNPSGGSRADDPPAFSGQCWLSGGGQDMVLLYPSGTVASTPVVELRRNRLDIVRHDSPTDIELTPLASFDLSALFVAATGGLPGPPALNAPPPSVMMLNLPSMLALMDMDAGAHPYAPLFGKTSSVSSVSPYALQFFFSTATPSLATDLLFVRIMPFNVIVCFNPTKVVPSGGSLGRWWLSTNHFVAGRMYVPVGTRADDCINLPTLWNGCSAQPTAVVGPPIAMSTFQVGGGDAYVADSLCVYRSKAVVQRLVAFVDAYADNSTTVADSDAVAAMQPRVVDALAVPQSIEPYFAGLKRAVTVPPTRNDGSLGLSVRSSPNVITRAQAPTNCLLEYVRGQSFDALFVDPRQSSATCPVARITTSAATDGITFTSLSPTGATWSYAPTSTAAGGMAIGSITSLPMTTAYAPLRGFTNAGQSPGALPIEFYFAPAGPLLPGATAPTAPALADLRFVRLPTLRRCRPIPATGCACATCSRPTRCTCPRARRRTSLSPCHSRLPRPPCPARW